MAPITRSGLCGACNTKLDRYDDRIKCVSCAENMHLECVNVTVEEYQRFNENDVLKQWKCPNCVDKVTDDSAAVGVDGGANKIPRNNEDTLKLI